MTNVPIHKSKATVSEPGLPDYEPGDPGVVIARTMIHVPGSALHQYWVRDQDHANQVWREHHGRDYEESPEVSHG
jgi:hypothetical protein